MDEKAQIRWNNETFCYNAYWLNSIIPTFQDMLKCSIILGVVLLPVFCSASDFSLIEQFFATNKVANIHLTLAELEANKLKVKPRKYVVADFAEGSTKPLKVGLKLKGGIGSFRTIDDKPAFTINFDKYADDQLFHGLDKFHLNNSVQDPTYMCEKLSSEIFLAAGIPTPRATHARVYLNGRDLGMYVLKEGFDKTFLRQHFKDEDGNLYDGGRTAEDVTDALEKDSGDGPDDHSDLKELVEAGREPDFEKRYQHLDKVLDIDKFLTFIAIEAMLWHWDGYMMHKSNYRLYKDPTSGKFVFLPHGMDQMFFNPQGPILPHQEGFVAKALLEIPRGREAYLKRFKEVFNNHYHADKLNKKVHHLRNILGPDLSEIGVSELKSFNDVTRLLESKINGRKSYLSNNISP